VDVEQQVKNERREDPVVVVQDTTAACRAAHSQPHAAANSQICYVPNEYRRFIAQFISLPTIEKCGTQTSGCLPFAENSPKQT